MYRFESEKALAKYTLDTGKVYPKSQVPKGSPLRKLLAHISRGGYRGAADADSSVDELTGQFGGRLYI